MRASTVDWPTSGLTLAQLAAFVRATISGDPLSPDVALVILVDELLKITDAEARNRLLDALAAFQQEQLGTALCTFVVVSSLCAMPVVNHYEANSQRPVHPVPLSPLAPTFTDSLLLREIKEFVHRTNAVDEETAIALREDFTRVGLAMVAVCGGHPRHVEWQLSKLRAMHRSAHDTVRFTYPPARAASYEEFVIAWGAFANEVCGRKLRVSTQAASGTTPVADMLANHKLQAQLAEDDHAQVELTSIPATWLSPDTSIWTCTSRHRTRVIRNVLPRHVNRGGSRPIVPDGDAIKALTMCFGHLSRRACARPTLLEVAVLTMIHMLACAHGAGCSLADVLPRGTAVAGAALETLMLHPHAVSTVKVDDVQSGRHFATRASFVYSLRAPHIEAHSGTGFARVDGDDAAAVIIVAHIGKVEGQGNNPFPPAGGLGIGATVAAMRDSEVARAARRTGARVILALFVRGNRRTPVSILQRVPPPLHRDVYVLLGETECARLFQGFGMSAITSPWDAKQLCDRAQQLL